MAYEVNTQNTVGYVTEHVSNLPAIIACGLQSPMLTSADPAYRQLRTPEMVQHLATRRFPIPGSPLVSEYVQLRYTTKNPMSNRLATGYGGQFIDNGEIIHFKCRLALVQARSLSVVFADRGIIAHSCQISVDPADVARVNQPLLVAGNFQGANAVFFDAAFYAFKCVPLPIVEEIICFDLAVKVEVEGLLLAAGHRNPVIVDRSAFIPNRPPVSTSP